MTIINPAGKVSNLMQSQVLLADLQQTQTQLQKVQSQISTGNIISQASDDPLIAGQLMSLNGLLDRITQYKSNTDLASSLLAAADTALGCATDLMRQASSMASSAANTTTSDSERAADAQQLSAIITQMMQLANTQVNGQIGRAHV